MSMLNADGSISDPYQNFIAVSRYARFNDGLGRRETWTESVDRYMNFMTKHLHSKHNYVPDESLVTEIGNAIKNVDFVPSMRALMTAGEALERSNIAGYNCSYLPIDDLAAFSEVLFILLNGTGVGFSVEKKYVHKLPPVPEYLMQDETHIIFGDSKEGWAHGYREFLESIWLDGIIPTFDLSNIRPAGARLKTFGGRASGPEPLRDLLEFTERALTKAAGRYLRPIEVHDLVCKIASVVVVGGVRRSAMISLSDLDDQEMAQAKSGEWWVEHPYRALANNSAVYEGGITREQFNAEWATLQASGSGERGIFNRDAARHQAARWGKRDLNTDYGTNPCGEIILRPRSFCNLSEVIIRPNDSAADLRRKVELATILGTWQSTLTDFPFLRPEWKKNAEEERLLGASLTGIYGNKLTSTGDADARDELLIDLNEAADTANDIEAGKIGIPRSHAICTVKPSGTVSQLAGVSSGIHPWHSKYYLRTVRADVKDPLAQLMIDYGVAHEPDVMNPDATVVFSFPVKAPDFAVTRESLSAVDHLELWLAYKRYWCDHNPSVTISVRGPRIVDPGPFSEALARQLVEGDDEANWTPELSLEFLNWQFDAEFPDDCTNEYDYARDLITWESGEWEEVADWVWEHLGELTGVSFLPYSEHTYKQAPYQEISAQEYTFHKAMQPDIRWADLPLYELYDQTSGSQTLACAADGSGCDSADLVSV
ncbi:ribonucleoside-triphosphate reductase, adenosylcobalamin-dependent [Nonomuraea roseoviolacea subsp. roseoviolacea]|uniref:hypothetical protein n=1 Tax=Nonomuraea roseoviolacea TaxID=103837 RepID=UPI0031D5E500